MKFVLSPLLFLLHICSLSWEMNSMGESLTPYTFQHGSFLNHREIHECQKTKYGTEPHETYPVHQSANVTSPFVNIKRFVKELPSGKRLVRGHYIVVTDPLYTLSVLEPDQVTGCSLNIRQTVSTTSEKASCVVAVNAGYFDTHKGTCYGNVISDNRRVQDSKGVQNVHFGLTEDGQIFIGYVSQDQFIAGNFKQLVGGVVWVLRNGTGYVNVSKTLECESSQETGTMEQFINILSARTIIGHNQQGHVVIVQVDGKSGFDGINLYEMETLLKDFKLVNALNLDGGGSSTLVINGTVVNYPYDLCTDGSFSCERKVSTVICIHAPYCQPNDCNHHGSCSMGACICEKNWLQPNCSILFCGEKNCTEHGICLPGGCSCHPGFYGENCDKTCEIGSFGDMCSQHCDCINAEMCDPVSGSCICKSGFIGKRCENVCPEGYFGLNCQLKCFCKNNCVCDPVTGSCDVPQNSSLYYAAKCLASNIIENQHLVEDSIEENKKWYITTIILGVISSMCITACLLLIFCSCYCQCHNEQVLCNKSNRRKYSTRNLRIPSGELSDSLSEENELYPMEVVLKNESK